MAQHVAALIEKARAATGDEKRATEKECFDAILALWQHRSELPNGKRPFEELEPVVRAIEALDPDNDLPRYFQSSRPPPDQSPECKEQASWLKIAEGLDYSARVLIGLALAEAAARAIDKSQDRVKVAEAAGFDPGPPGLVVRFVRSTGVGKEPDPHKTERKLLTDRASRLRGFIGIAEQFASALEDGLAKLPPAPADAEDDEEEYFLDPRPKLGE